MAISSRLLVREATGVEGLIQTERTKSTPAALRRNARHIERRDGRFAQKADFCRHVAPHVQDAAASGCSERDLGTNARYSVSAQHLVQGSPRFRVFRRRE